MCFAINLLSSEIPYSVVASNVNFSCDVRLYLRLNRLVFNVIIIFEYVQRSERFCLVFSLNFIIIIIRSHVPGEVR